MKTFFPLFLLNLWQLTGFDFNNNTQQIAYRIVVIARVFANGGLYGINKLVVAAFWANTEPLGVRFRHNPFKDYMTVNFSALELNA